MIESVEDSYKKNLKKTNIAIISILIITIILLVLTSVSNVTSEGPGIVYVVLFLFMETVTFFVIFFTKKTNKVLRIGLYITLSFFILVIFYLGIIWTMSLSGINLEMFRTLDRTSLKFILFAIFFGILGIIESLLIPLGLILTIIGLFLKSDKKVDSNNQH